MQYLALNSLTVNVRERHYGQRTAAGGTRLSQRQLQQQQLSEIRSAEQQLTPPLCGSKKKRKMRVVGSRMIGCSLALATVSGELRCAAAKQQGAGTTRRQGAATTAAKKTKQIDAAGRQPQTAGSRRHAAATRTARICIGND
jgi:hypothetical protein